MKHIVSVCALNNLGAPLADLIEEFSRADFDGISINPQPLMGFAGSDLRNLISIIADHNMLIALHGEFQSSVKELADLAQLIGCQLANITFDPVLGWTSAGLLFRMEKMGPFLIELEHVAQVHGFKYGVEDFPETPFAVKMYQESLSRLLESDHFGILIDIGHFNESANKYGYFKGISPEEHFAQLPLQLLEVHLSDNDGEEDPHLPLGMGTIDFKSVARGLKNIAFSGFSTIEIEPRKECRNSIAKAKQDILKSHSYWKQTYEEELASKNA